MYLGVLKRLRSILFWTVWILPMWFFGASPNLDAICPKWFKGLFVEYLVCYQLRMPSKKPEHFSEYDDKFLLRQMLTPADEEIVIVKRMSRLRPVSWNQLYHFRHRHKIFYFSFVGELSLYHMNWLTLSITWVLVKKFSINLCLLLFLNLCFQFKCLFLGVIVLLKTLIPLLFSDMFNKEMLICIH